MPKLKDLKIRGVALVDRGANQHAKVLISKRSADMKKAEITNQADCEAAGGTWNAESNSCSVPSEEATAKRQLATAQAALKQATDELTDLKGSGALTSDLATLKKQYDEKQRELTKVRADLQKQLDDANKELEASRAEAMKIQKARRRDQFIGAVQKLADLPGAPADDFAEILDNIEAGLRTVAPEKAEKQFAKLTTLLSSWNAIVKQSKVFETMGRGGATVAALSGPEGVLHGMAKELAATSKISYEQAYAKVLKDNPDIYQRYRAEKES